MAVLTSVVLILAGITAWCVASLALALIVGPMVRSADRRRHEDLQVLPMTGAIRVPVSH